MKKLLLIAFGAALLNFQGCIGKDSTADKDNSVDDGMNTSETTLGSGSTRPEDMNQNSVNATEVNGEGIDDGLDTTNTEMGDKRIETGTTPGVQENNQGQPNYKKEDAQSK